MVGECVGLGCRGGGERVCVFPLKFYFIFFLWMSVIVLVASERSIFGGYFNEQNEQTHQFNGYIKLYCSNLFILHSKSVSNWLQHRNIEILLSISKFIVSYFLWDLSMHDFTYVYVLPNVWIHSTFWLIFYGKTKSLKGIY